MSRKHSTHTLLFGALALVFAASTGCRGCGHPPEARPHAEPEGVADASTAAEPTPEPEPAPAPESLDASAPTDAGPTPGPTADGAGAHAPPAAGDPDQVALAMLQRVVSSDQPIDAIRAEAARSGQDSDLANQVVTAYLRCRAVRTPAVCDRLAAARRQKCRVDPSLVAARAQSDHGWSSTPAALQQCNEAHMPEGVCRLIGTSIESGSATGCGAMSGEMAAYCEVMASGDTNACSRMPRERSCPEEVEFYALLRRGVDALRTSADPSVAAYAIGLDPSPQACEDFVRAHVHEIAAHLPPPSQQPQQ